jgi:Uma2 family endonuclease
MSTAARFVPHYTVKDYLLWKGDWELWNGIAIAMTPSPFGRHQNILAGLLTSLRVAIDQTGCRATALSELDWIVNESTVVRPDILIVCSDAPDKHLERPPALVAEVLSPSTRQNDLTYKRELYAQEGVGIYLILDPDSQTVEHLELTVAGTYEPADSATRLELHLCGDCELDLEIAKFFR